MGAFSSSFFSALLGIVGCAKLLQAIARYAPRKRDLTSRDNLLSFLGPFSQGTAIDDEPTMAVLVTYFLTQATLFSNINQIASFVTMTFLLTFMVVNLACFLLKYIRSLQFLILEYRAHRTFGLVSITFGGILRSLGLLSPLLPCTSSMVFTPQLPRGSCSPYSC